MIIIGLTGSIAMGKSATANMFRKLEIPVFDADSTVHKLYDNGGAGVKAISQIYPEAIKNDKVDRKILSRLIINKPEILSKIESVIHPLVAKAEMTFVEEQAKLGAKIVVIDNPILFESGTDSRMDKTIIVSTSSEIQKKRALARENMTVEKLEFLLSRQMPDKEKRTQADFVIDTSISFSDAFDQLQNIVLKLNPCFQKIENPYA